MTSNIYRASRRSWTEGETYIEILDTNKELRKELDEEISINKNSEKKICSLIKKVKTCYRSLIYQDSTIIAHEDEIISLKAEISSLKSISGK